MTVRKRYLKYLLSIFTLLLGSLMASADSTVGMISGKVLSLDGEPIDYATVFLKGTSYTCSTNEKGLYHLSASRGEYILVFSAVGFEKKELRVSVNSGERKKLNVKLKPSTQLGEVIVVGNQLSKVRNSAFNATAVNT